MMVRRRRDSSFIVWKGVERETEVQSRNQSNLTEPLRSSLKAGRLRYRMQVEDDHWGLKVE